MFSSSLSDLMKSTEVDESLSTTSTDVLFQRIPTNFKITMHCEKSDKNDKNHDTPRNYTFIPIGSTVVFHCEDGGL